MPWTSRCRSSADSSDIARYSWQACQIPLPGLRQNKVRAAVRYTRDGPTSRDALPAATAAVFVPADYRDALSVLAVADVPSALDPMQVDELLATLNGHAVEQQFCAVMLDLVDRGIGFPLDRCGNAQLEELVGYFLETGISLP